MVNVKFLKIIDNLFGKLATYIFYASIIILIYLFIHKPIEGKMMFYEDYYNQKNVNK